MPINPTYPGVYIEELPSTVHTIVGVSTAVTAFVGWTKRGPANQATHIFSYGDFERAFGGLDPECPLTYAVSQYFANGGTEAWIVRVANNALTAQVTLADANGHDVLELRADSSGTWANPLQIAVDYGTLNPESLFNLTVTAFEVSGGALVPSATESFRNLTLNEYSPTYAVDVVNYGSKLVAAKRGAGFGTGGFAAGTSTSPAIGSTTALAGADNRLALSVDGGPTTEISFGAAANLSAIKDAINTTLTGAGVTGVTAGVVGTGSSQQLQLTSADTTDEKSSVRVLAASKNDAAPTLKLGVQNGGTEIDAAAAFMPVPTGTVGRDLDAALGGTLPGALDASTSALQVKVAVTVGGATSTSPAVTLLPQTQAFATKEDLRKALEHLLRTQASALPDVAGELSGARVNVIDNRLVVSAGGRPGASIAILNASGTDTTANKIGFNTTPASTNVAAYSPMTTTATLSQLSGTLGSDGGKAQASDIQGDPTLNTGIYALSHVDLFNLLVLPDDAATNTEAVMSAAMTYCEERRAFLIVDPPTNVDSLSAAYGWITDPGTPKSANAAAYFPRLDFPDPMQAYRPRPMASAGAIAGLYARIDASRGVWKAPAGTEATLRGPSGVDVQLNDLEQGTLNPLGLNVNRALPVYGNVVWGARTLDGADQLASQWKYVPVRRLALYIEESLFRGTKWAVFEPNDEPLWAQIRLSVGTFMHNLFRQHAFEGSSPRQAYLVKCDGETTTQADIDLGIVNIIVGFAPLKPAEFVVLQITQLAGQLEV